MALIELSGIHKYYGEGEAELHVLKEIALEVEDHEYLAIVGASGSGKSTLMNIVGCLDRPDAGRYLLDGRDVSRLEDDQLSSIRNREIGFVFQSFMLIPQLDVVENVEVPLFYRGTPKTERRERAVAVLDLVGLGHRTGHLPSQLSGGERQRVAIARSLVNDPTLLLADEPTGNLDSQTGKEILRVMEELHEQGRTIVLVTHDPTVAGRTERTITIKDGRIIEDIRPRPAGAAS